MTQDSTAALADAIDAALPQTQCTRCGYPDCRSYAQAVAAADAGINQCPPGGQVGIERLAELTGRPVIALSADHGVEAPRRVAIIDEPECIGCTLCLKACPVDCIIGGPKAMHTVDEPACTGCELCVPACPVDCITMTDIAAPAAGWSAWTPRQAEDARRRYVQHRSRLDRDTAERQQRLQAATRAAVAKARGLAG